MTEIYKVSVKPSSAEQLGALKDWCNANTEQWGTTLSGMDELRKVVGMLNFYVESQKRGLDAERPEVVFEFANAEDATMFKLVFGEQQ